MSQGSHREMVVTRAFQRAIPRGRVPGTKNAETIKKQAAADVLRAAIQEHVKPMLISMFTAGFGSHKFFFKTDKGKWEQTSDENIILDLLNGGVEGTDFKWEKIGGDWRALDALMDRAFGRPKETIEHQGEVRGIIQVIQQLEHGDTEEEEGGGDGEGETPSDEPGERLQRADPEEDQEPVASREVPSERSYQVSRNQSQTHAGEAN